MLKPDVRSFKNKEDCYDRCRVCGTPLVVLPDDRRQGYCFDCFVPLETSMREFCTRVPELEASLAAPARH
jgi:hypothetical protein